MQRSRGSQLRNKVKKNEYLIAEKLVKVILATGSHITVYDEEELSLPASTDRNEILDALASTGMDTLEMPFGRVILIWGNDKDLIHDASTGNIMDGILDTVGRYVGTL